MVLQSINPAGGQLIAEYDEMDREQAAATVDLAHAAFLEWRDVSFESRAEMMRAAARILLVRVDDSARLMAEEMGKPVLVAEAR